jgi:hypothetical protein
MAADCTVIVADHPDSATDEVIGDARFLFDPAVDDLTMTLEGEIRNIQHPRKLLPRFSLLPDKHTGESAGRLGQFLEIIPTNSPGSN